MKSTLRVLTLVLVLVLVWAKDNDNDPQCEDLKKTIHPQHLNKTEGSWVLVWAVSTGSSGQAHLPKLISQHLTVTLLDNNTIHYDEKNSYRNQKWNCSRYVLNATVVNGNNQDNLKLESDGGISTYPDKEGPFSDNITISFYRSCEHCLHVGYSSTGWDHFLFIYRREGHLADVEQKEKEKEKESYLKRAECLGFPTEPGFEYDGSSEFCHVTSPQTNADS